MLQFATSSTADHLVWFTCLKGIHFLGNGTFTGPSASPSIKKITNAEELLPRGTPRNVV